MLSAQGADVGQPVNQSLPLPGFSPLYTLLTHCQTWNRSTLQFGDLHAERCSLIQEWLIYLTSTNSVETHAEKSLCWLFQSMLMQVASALKARGFQKAGSSQSLPS